MFNRIVLFLATNLAVLVLLSIVMAVLQNVFGITLGNNGTLLVFATLFGFGGSLISLMISKWMAKRSTGAHVIEQPRNESEQWLVSTVRRQAEAAGIKMPEVAIYDAPEINAFATGPSRNNSLVAVSTGLLRAMNRQSAIAAAMRPALQESHPGAALGSGELQLAPLNPAEQSSARFLSAIDQLERRIEELQSSASGHSLGGGHGPSNGDPFLASSVAKHEPSLLEK